MSKQVPGNENPSILISFATKSSNAGQITSKLHVIELGAQPGLFNTVVFAIAFVHSTIYILTFLQ